MQKIDEDRLESELSYRFEYLADFIGFGQAEIEAIHNSASQLAPVVPALVDAVYVKLFSYDATKRHFLPRNQGFEGSLEMDLEKLTLDHEQIKFRKGHLARYLTKLVSDPYNDAMVGYLNGVGKMHTPQLGSNKVDVPLVQMNVLMGFVSDALLATIAGLGLDRETEVQTLRAFNKLLWIQNDLINRHYQAAVDEPEVALAG